MIERVAVEIVDEPTRSPVSAGEVAALVKVEQIKLERTKLHSLAAVVCVALLSWAAVCHATCRG